MSRRTSTSTAVSACASSVTSRTRRRAARTNRATADPLLRTLTMTNNNEHRYNITLPRTVFMALALDDGAMSEAMDNAHLEKWSRGTYTLNVSDEGAAAILWDVDSRAE